MIDSRSIITQWQKYNILKLAQTQYHGRPQMGGGWRIGVHPPPLENQTFFFTNWGGLSATFSLCGSLFATFFFWWEAKFSPCQGLSALFLCMWDTWGLFFTTYFYLWGGGGFFTMRRPFSPCDGLSAPFFSMWWAFFPLTGTFYGRAPMHITYINILSW